MDLKRFTTKVANPRYGAGLKAEPFFEESLHISNLIFINLTDPETQGFPTWNRNTGYRTKHPASSRFFLSAIEITAIQPEIGSTENVSSKRKSITLLAEAKARKEELAKPIYLRESIQNNFFHPTSEREHLFADHEKKGETPLYPKLREKVETLSLAAKRAMETTVCAGGSMANLSLVWESGQKKQGCNGRQKKQNTQATLFKNSVNKEKNNLRTN